MTDIPLSEDPAKITVASKDECIAHLRDMAESEPERFITRNHFRVNGPLSESAWSCHFGTFTEFKRQAAIIPSRHAHRLEQSIARHASMDKIRKLNDQRQGYIGRYMRPSGHRHQITLVCSDVHDRACDPFYRRMFVTAAKRIVPERVVFNGDIFDMPEFSRFNVDPREWDPIGRIRWVHEFMRDLREACPDAQFDFIEGNHEYRLLRHLGEQTPAMRTILAELHGMTVSKLLGLDEFCINYIARGDLTAFTAAEVRQQISRNYLVIHGCLVAHHFPEGKKFGMPGWNGHHHKHLVASEYNPMFGSYEWHQLGAGHRRVVDYANGERWSNGFLVVHTFVEQKMSTFEYIEIKDFAVLGGVIYQREREELI